MSSKNKSHYHIELFKRPPLHVSISDDVGIVYVRDEFSEDEPTMIFLSGSKIWKLNDKYHRLTGPAVISSNGQKLWYRNGYLHRERGPAIENINGSVEYWIHGQYKPFYKEQHE